mmetsp:Transcript_21959/g.60786  ORF Transcript_21959/g.60786 Transcript_21959/m.60786 type:complete len:604 (-) Transcript_21959:770-2581(-)
MQGCLVLEERGLGGSLVQGPCGEGEVQAVHHAHDEDVGDVPAIGRLGGHHTVLRQRNHGTIVEDSHDDDEDGGEVPVVDDGDQAKGEADTEGHGDGVLGVGGHALEDLARADHRRHDGGQARLRQHDVGSTTSSIGGVSHSHTHVSLLQGGCVIHTITCHADDVVGVLQDLDDLKLVLREHLGKAVAGLHHLHKVLVAVQLACVAIAGLDHDLTGEHLSAHAQHLGGFLPDKQVVTSDHLDLDALVLAVLDGLLGVVARGVKQRQQRQHLPLGAIFAVAVCHSQAQRAEAAVCKFHHLLVHGGIQLGCIPRLGQHHLRRALQHAEHPAGGDLQARCDGNLVIGVEGEVLGVLVVPLNCFPVWIRLPQHHIDGLLCDCVGRQGAHSHDLIHAHVAHRHHHALVNGQLVQGEGAGFVRAQHIHACHLLYGAHTGDDGTLACKLVGTQGEGHGQHSGHGNGNTAHQHHQHIQQGGAALSATNAFMRVVPKLHGQLDNDPQQDGDDADGAHLVHDSLQVGYVVGAADEGSCTSEEGVHTSSIHHCMALSLLDARAAEGHVARELLGRKGLSCEGGLVDLHGRFLLPLISSLFFQQLDVCWYDVAQAD